MYYTKTMLRRTIYAQVKMHPQLIKNVALGNSLPVQWLGLQALTAEGPSSIPGQGTKILQATWHGQKKKKKKKK